MVGGDGGDGWWGWMVGVDGGGGWWWLLIWGNGGKWMISHHSEFHFKSTTTTELTCDFLFLLFILCSIVIVISLLSVIDNYNT